MPFVWVEDISQDSVIHHADLHEIRTNVDYVEDNKCAADDVTVHASFNVAVDAVDKIGYDATDRGTVHVGDDAAVDGGHYTGFDSSDDTSYDAAYDATVHSGDDAGYNGTNNAWYDAMYET